MRNVTGRHWKPCIVVLVILSGLWYGGTANAGDPPVGPPPTPYGPLRLVNQQPLQLLFLQLFPDAPKLVPVRQALIHLNLALTNTLVQQKRDFTADLDLEMVRAVVDLRYGVLPNLEIGLEIPYLFTYSGILDNFIDEGVEKTLGGERELRVMQDAGAFTYQVSRGDRRFIGGRDNALGFGDVVLKIKISLVEEEIWRPAIALRAAVKFPTGSTARAFGSGEFDGALGVLMQKTFGRMTVHVNGDVTFPGEVFAEADVRPFFGGIAAGEYYLGRNVSLVLQFRGDTRPFHDTIPILDKRIIEVLFGVNWAVNRRLILQGGFAEDIFDSACCSADVSFFVNLTTRL